MWNQKDKLARFEETVLPHMDAAYNLARWLTRNEHDAEDMAQEAYLRAFKFFDGFRGTDARAWLLAIVRNTCYTWLQQSRWQDRAAELDEELLAIEDETSNPADMVIHSRSMEMLKESLGQLPAQFREIIVLRDLEEFSYKQIAEITKIPMGTVMSRLARARDRLKRIYTGRLREKP